MASSDGTEVTIDRGYFETLVRRAKFNSESFETPVSEPPPIAAVGVSKAEYDNLQRIARQYANLRQNLLRGGVGEETIALLSQDDATIQQENQPPPPRVARLDKNIDGGVRLNVAPRSPAAKKSAPAPRRASMGSGYGNLQAHGGAGSRPQEPLDWADASVVLEDASFSVDAPADADAGHNGHTHNGQQPPSRPQFDRNCTRTVQLSNLPDGVTHADITAVIRGGMLLDVFLRTHERSATVSFLRAAEARSFFDHVKKHDLYIKNKRVEVRWNERQFILAGHVASKIGIGASRNLVIRRCDPKVTEHMVREDLDHIHNLVVIKVDFIGGTCYISTNSVHNAMFARTCMMSRARYKGSKIDWDVDECAQPFERVPASKPKKDAIPAKKAPSSMANRFHLLNLEDDEEEDEITSAFQRAKKPVGIAA